MNDREEANAQVIGVYPNKLRVSVVDLKKFKARMKLKVGSYLKVIGDDRKTSLISMIENFSITSLEIKGNVEHRHIIEAQPLGVLCNDEFTRGGDELTLPPQDVMPATEEDIKVIFENAVEENKQFIFSKLASNENIEIPVDGDKFFNKHIAVVGSTGSGKSHTVASLLQTAIKLKDGEYKGLNNSHIIIFDIHSEYKSAFPNANYIDIENLALPYWMLKSEELEELFLDTEANDHNQKNIFKEAIIKNRKELFQGNTEEKELIHYDSVMKFNLESILDFAKQKNTELIPTGEIYKTGDKKGEEKYNNGSLHGKLTNFISRLENKINDKRLEFLIGKKSQEITFQETVESLLGYNKDNKSNVTIIDLSGVPFEVLSITVALISRIVFDFGYIYKRLKNKEAKETDVPFLLVYEEAHQYVPRSDLVKYRSSRQAIERIAKEGRKYGVTLLLASQRPSEISETIFAQCNNFIAMRLTNPNDQMYVEKLLPDTMGSLTTKLPTLRQGEALLIGESIILPSVVKINKCDQPPSSSDVQYWQLWKEEWKDIDIEKLKSEWIK